MSLEKEMSASSSKFVSDGNRPDYSQVDFNDLTNDTNVSNNNTAISNGHVRQIYCQFDHELEDSSFERSFWLCNRRSFTRRHVHHHSLKRQHSTRSHDGNLFRRMCKVKPITAKEKKKETEWKQDITEFQKRKQSEDKIKTIPKKSLRSFYKSQDNLIASYEELSKAAAASKEINQRRSAEFYAKISFFANVFLLAAKTAASLLSGSIAIISSLVDSVVDLASGIVIWATSRAVRNCDYQQFPKGRKTLEPLAIIVLSVIMALASLQLVNESIQRIIGLANDTKIPPTVDYVTIAIASVTVVTKLILYLLCRKVESPTVKALAQDHRNDVLSNALAIVCGYLGSQEFRRETNLQFMVYVDPIGAITICLYIAITWFITGKTQAKILTGLTADPTFISKITWICLNHHYSVTYVQSVTAYHSGYNFVTEVDIVMADDLTFKESCDVTASLQETIQSLTDVERAYVTSNYEVNKKKNEEIQIG